MNCSRVIAFSIVSGVLFGAQVLLAQSSPPSPAAPPEVRGYVRDDGRCFDAFRDPEGGILPPTGLAASWGGGAPSSIESEDKSARGRRALVDYVTSHPTEGRRFVVVKHVDARGRQDGWIAFCVVARPIVEASELSFAPPRATDPPSRRVLRSATLSEAARERLGDSLGDAVLFLSENDAMHGIYPIALLLDRPSFDLGFDR